MCAPGSPRYIPYITLSPIYPYRSYISPIYPYRSLSISQHVPPGSPTGDQMRSKGQQKAPLRAPPRAPQMRSQTRESLFPENRALACTGTLPRKPVLAREREARFKVEHCRSMFSIGRSHSCKLWKPCATSPVFYRTPTDFLQDPNRFFTEPQPLFYRTPANFPHNPDQSSTGPQPIFYRTPTNFLPGAGGGPLLRSILKASP